MIPFLSHARLGPSAIAALTLALAACEQQATSVTVTRADLQQKSVSAPASREVATRVPDRAEVSVLVAQARAPESGEQPHATPAESPRVKAAPRAPTGAGKPSAAARRVTDSELAARVKSAVLAQPLSALMFNVSVSNGIVTLSGSADSQDTRDKAGRAAADVAGVKSVENRISVLSGS